MAHKLHPRPAADKAVASIPTSQPGKELGSMVATIQIPPGAVTVNAPPVLWGAACAGYLGMGEEQARRVLREMADDPGFRGCVVVLSRRPRELAAPPDDVLRYLRARRGVAFVVAACANDSNEQQDGAARVLEELGLARSTRGGRR